MGLARGAVAVFFLVALVGSLPRAHAKSADEMSAAELQADAQRIVDKLQGSYEAALKAVADANASGDPSAIENANAALTRGTTLLNKAQNDKKELDKAIADGKPIEEIRQVYAGLSEAEAMDTETQSALASVSGTGAPTTTGATGTLDTQTTGSQPALDTTEASNSISNSFQTTSGQGSGYETDKGTGGRGTTSVDDTVIDQSSGTPTGLF